MQATHLPSRSIASYPSPVFDSFVHLMSMYLNACPVSMGLLTLFFFFCPPPCSLCNSSPAESSSWLFLISSICDWLNHFCSQVPWRSQGLFSGKMKVWMHPGLMFRLWMSILKMLCFNSYCKIEWKSLYWRNHDLGSRFLVSLMSLLRCVGKNYTKLCFSLIRWT